MVEFLFGTMINAFWFSLLIGPVVLFILRLYYGLYHRFKMPRLLKLVCLPWSIGFFMEITPHSRFKQVYIISLIFQFSATVLGSFFVLFTHLNHFYS